MMVAALLAALAIVPNVERARYLMGTTCEIALSGPEAESQIEAAFAEAKRIELMLSTWIDDSELIRVNRGAQPSPELKALLDQALEWSQKTNGAFDPRWNGKGFEAGAFGKGYALDRMLALTRGDAMINFGGQIIVRGAHEVTIASPTDRRKPIFTLTLTNASLSTSSQSEQPGHIIDPRTHQSVSGRGSVSVIANDALTADILSTALFVMGEDEGLRWADAHGAAAIFIDSANHIRLSAAARRNYALKE